VMSESPALVLLDSINDLELEGPAVAAHALHRASHGSDRRAGLGSPQGERP